tara:strand:+ start:189 stop:398 length:210 start_codon:yes stop_codon:yes gene_type:complete
MKILLAIIVIFIPSCSVGPFEIEHKEGTVPKAKVNVTEGCKLRGRYNGNKSNARYVCNWEIDEFFNIVK